MLVHVLEESSNNGQLMVTADAVMKDQQHPQQQMFTFTTLVLKLNSCKNNRSVRLTATDKTSLTKAKAKILSHVLTISLD